MAWSRTVSMQMLAGKVVEVFVVTFSFMVLLSPLWDGRIFYSSSSFEVEVAQESSRLELGLDGVVLSRSVERFNHTQHFLAQLGFSHVVQRVPAHLDEWSNQMAFVKALEEFVKEAVTSTPKRWRFFFEDDVALNPDIAFDLARVAITKGLEVADGHESGFVYFGVCDPSCDEDGVRGLDMNVEAARCYGTCEYAFGVQATTAAKLLDYMRELQVRSSTHLHIYLGQYMAEFGRDVKKGWVLGSNLQSPVDHSQFGLLCKESTILSAATAQDDSASTNI